MKRRPFDPRRIRRYEFVGHGGNASLRPFRFRRSWELLGRYPRYIDIGTGVVCWRLVIRGGPNLKRAWGSGLGPCVRLYGQVAARRRRLEARWARKGCRTDPLSS